MPPQRERRLPSAGMGTTRLSRHVRAPRADVYRALLDADAVRRWMVPDGMTSEVHEFAAHEGGRFRISLTYDDPTTTGKTTAQTDTFHGRFVRLVPDTEVVQAVEFETDDPPDAGRAMPAARSSSASRTRPRRSSPGRQCPGRQLWARTLAGSRSAACAARYAMAMIGPSVAPPAQYAWADAEATQLPTP